MELVTFGKEVLQNIAEQAASYRLGQSALRTLDRGLWVVEKCARWAVPPPLDQDERPQPELVRPLPWVFFLALIIALRVTRESISLLNLVMGKPPLRSADVVMYIQSKRRYLRTLKYQGSRMMRARTSSAQPPRSWYNRVHSLLEFTMCFRRQSYNYENNNTTRVSNNDEVLVVKRSKRTRQPQSPVASTSDPMERLIEKMMVDLDADSDDDSSFTLTNVTSIRSDRSDSADSDQDTILHNDNDVMPNSTIPDPRRTSVEINFSPNKSAVSTPERNPSPIKNDVENDSMSEQKTNNTEEALEVTEDAALVGPAGNRPLSPKEETKLFLQTEMCSSPKIQRKTGTKTLKNWSVIAITEGIMRHKYAKEMGLNSERRDSDVSEIKTKAADITK